MCGCRLFSSGQTLTDFHAFVGANVDLKSVMAEDTYGDHCLRRAGNTLFGANAPGRALKSTLGIEER